MKTLTSYLASFVFFITLVSFASSTIADKPTNCFSQFRAHRQADGAALSWAVSVNDVTSFVIERSYDAEFFEPVTEIECNGTSTHKYKDDQAFPGYIHYRITAVKADGSSEQSPVETVRIVKRR